MEAPKLLVDAEETPRAERSLSTWLCDPDGGFDFGLLARGEVDPARVLRPLAPALLLLVRRPPLLMISILRGLNPPADELPPTGVFDPVLIGEETLR